MERWDKYRQDKEELIKQVIQTLKNLKRTKQWIVLIKRQSMMAHTNENYMIHRDYIIQVFASLVIAIKFKVRIFVKLQKRYGFCYCKRQERFVKRHLTLYALCSHENKSIVSKGILLKFLLRVYMIKQMQIKSKSFVIGAESLQRHWLVTIASANEKKARIRHRFDVELQYIIKYYWKKLNEIGKPNSKAYKAI